MGTSVRRNKTNKTARGKKSKSDRGGRTSRTNPVFIATVAHAGNAPSAAAQSALTDFDRISRMNSFPRQSTACDIAAGICDAIVASLAASAADASSSR